MSLIRNPDQDEMRNGTVITVRRKKLWQYQLEMILEFQHFCEKHNLKWFATSGTLLAAIKFHGFNPTDFIISLAMLRPDYDRFRKIAREEFHYPILLDAYYDHEYPEGTIGAGRWPVFPLIKIRDERTTMLEHPKWKDLPQGIWMDVAPLDSFPPFANPELDANFEVLRTLYSATFSPAAVTDSLKKEAKFPISKDQFQKFLELPYKKRAEIFEMHCGKMFKDDSKYLGTFLNMKLRFEHNWFEKIEWIPFENSALPIPSGYEQILKTYYSDYPNTKLFRNIDIWSTDISWREYFAQVEI